MAAGAFFSLFLGLLALGVPFCAAFGFNAIAPAILGSGSYSLSSVVGTITQSLSNFVLLALPLFMLSGAIMAEGKISIKLFNLFSYFFGKHKAGLPCVVIMTCAFYSAISGSSVATVAAVGSMTIPLMMRLKYDKVFSVATVTVGGTLGVVIPPSISYIVYAGIAAISPADLFKAGFVPGLMISVAMMIYIFIWCSKHEIDEEKMLEEYHALRERGFWNVFKDSSWALLMPVIVLGSIYSGTCSPTEAAVISVVYSYIISMFVYKTMNWKGFLRTFVSGAETFLSIMIVIGIATALARTMTLQRYTVAFTDFMISGVSSKYAVLFFLNVIMILVGMILDSIPSIVLLAPLFLPIARAFGIDYSHLGMIMTVNLCIGMVTPPVGCCLFVGSGMSDVPMLKLAKASLPYLAFYFLCLMLLTYIPQITLFLIK